MNFPRANFEGKLTGPEPIRVYYTGVKLDGTTAITAALYKGAVVAFVPEANGGEGLHVTQPEDGSSGDNISLVAGVVEKFEATTGAQWITILPRVARTCVNASTHADMDPVTPTFLVATSGQFYLSAAAIASAGNPTLKEIFDPCAAAMEDHDSSSTTANKTIMWR